MGIVLLCPFEETRRCLAQRDPLAPLAPPLSPFPRPISPIRLLDLRKPLDRLLHPSEALGRLATPLAPLADRISVRLRPCLALAHEPPAPDRPLDVPAGIAPAPVYDRPLALILHPQRSHPAPPTSISSHSPSDRLDGLIR